MGTLDGQTLVRMTRKDERCWGLMPKLTYRMHQFCEERGMLDAAELCQRLEATFLLNEDQMLAWVVLDPSGARIVAHLVVQETVWCGRRVGLVVQAVNDRDALSWAGLRAANEEMKEWGRARGFTEILAYTDHFTSRAWHHLFDFEEYRWLMRQDLGKGS